MISTISPKQTLTEQDQGDAFYNGFPKNRERHQNNLKNCKAIRAARRSAKGNLIKTEAVALLRAMRRGTPDPKALARQLAIVTGQKPRLRVQAVRG